MGPTGTQCQLDLSQIRYHVTRTFGEKIYARTEFCGKINNKVSPGVV